MKKWQISFFMVRSCGILSRNELEGRPKIRRVHPADKKITEERMVELRRMSQAHTVAAAEENKGRDSVLLENFLGDLSKI